MSKPKTAAKRWPMPPRTTAVLLVIAFLIVVSTALATEGAMLRRNTSNTPDLETDQAQISVAQFYVDAQRANGTLVVDEVFDDANGNGTQDDGEEDLPGALQYFAETGDPDDADALGRDFASQEDFLMDERTIAKPIVVTYTDEVEHDAYDADGIPDNTQASLLGSLGGELADAVDAAFGAEALASGGEPDPEHRTDAFASVSFDDGESWSRVNLSESALRSSFTTKDGTEFAGSVDTVKHAMAGNKIVVMWTSFYAGQGSPRYSLKALDENGEPILDADGEPYAAEYLGLDGESIVKYEDAVAANWTNVYMLDLDGDETDDPVPLDIWGVSGAQKYIDYAAYNLHGLFPFAAVGEVPFRTIWTARGVIQQCTVLDENGDPVIADEATGETEKYWGVKWRKAERLTSGVRDAYSTGIDGAEGAGFSIVWQEDPAGLRPGAGEGPGEGWSGAVANHKTDIWYSYLKWEDFDKVENPLVIPTAVYPSDEYVAESPTTTDYFQTPEEVDALGWDTETFVLDGEDVTTNKPQVFARFSMPQRISDNNNVRCATVGGDGDITDTVEPYYSLETGKMTDVYAWIDRDGNEVPDMADKGYTWVNNQGVTITNAITEDGRLMNGQTASTRTRIMMEGYVKEDDTRGAWVLLGYEETKGLGPGAPETTGDGQDEDEAEPPDIGKNVKADTFAFDKPSFAKPGHMINAPDLMNPGYGDVVPYTGLIENDFGELQYATPIARRPSLFTNPIIKLDADGVVQTALEGGMTSAVMLYKEGTMKQGGPADIFMRRWVLPDDYDAAVDNPFAFENLAVDLPPDYDGLSGTYTYVDEDGATVTEPVCPIWTAEDLVDGVPSGTWDPDPDGNGWDEEIVTGGLSRSAYPSVAATEGFTSEYYPNGVMVRGAQNLSSTIPLYIQPLEPGEGGGTAAETVPSWHLDIMPDLADKVEVGTLTFEDCASCHADNWAANEDGDPVHGITDRVYWWTQVGETATQSLEESQADALAPLFDEANFSDPDMSAAAELVNASVGNQYDFHWTNGFEFAKGHRGYIDGTEVVMMFGYSPNWLIASHGKEPTNLFMRRSFDGGATWSTTPATGANADGFEYLGVGTIYDQVQGTGDSADSGKVFFYTEEYAAGDFERMRNMSQFYSSSQTIIDPRYSPTNFRRQTSISRKLADDQTGYLDGTFVWDLLGEPFTPAVTADSPLVEGSLDEAQLAAARPDDIRDPSKNFAVFETGNTAAVADGAEATAENLFYSRATEWGDTWEEVIWYPGDNNPNTDAEEALAWDWLENSADDCSGEAAIAGSAGGQFFYAVWNQWCEDEDEHVWDSDAIFRRCYWVPDEVRTDVFPFIRDLELLTAADGEVVTLTADATATVGGEPAPASTLEDLVYAWDLDANGSFETLGQSVTMVASGAMQRVSVVASDPVSGAEGLASGYINDAVNGPRVWNVRLVKGETGLAGSRVALSANFRSPGKGWNAPAPADYDHAISPVIDWGDGTIEAGTIASKNDGKGSQRFVTGVHKYGKPGLYTVKVTVTDAYGNSGWDYLEYAVIVHRKAGALAMAGTFDDPAGAGEASIAANVKYKLKGKYPSGKVLFSLGEMSFVSEKLDWMAISGRKGWVRGQGQLNGVGGYEFLLAVFDDRQNLGDLVRVKVWKANGKMETVIYDSQPDSPLDAVAVTPMKTGKITMPLFKGKSWKYYLMQKK